MPRSSRRIATVALSLLLLSAAPSLAGPRAGSETGGPAAGLIKVQDGLLQSVWGWLNSLWSAFGEAGDAGARIDGNGPTDSSVAQVDGDAGARIDGNGAY